MLSHIQIPAFLLKQFKAASGRTLYYDLSRKEILHTSFRKLGTEENFYSSELEKFINKEYERPFSCWIGLIKEIEQNNKECFGLSSSFFDEAIEFLKCMTLRSKHYHEKVKNGSVFLQFAKNSNDIIFSAGIGPADKLPLFEGMGVTFAINRTSIHFVTGMQPSYSAGPLGKHLIFLPIAPFVSLVYFKKEDLDFFSREDGIILLRLAGDEDVRKLNWMCYNEQLAMGGKFVVADRIDELREIKEWDTNGRKPY